jgi:hypothetical protein
MNGMRCFSSIFFVLAVVVTDGFSRPITGATVVHLNAPVTPAIREKALAIAAGYFKTDCVEWMKEESGIAVDTQNAIWNFHLSTFTENCFKLAKQETKFFGRDWTITVTLSSEQAEAALKEHNARCHRLSLSTWTNLKKMLEKDISGDVFRLGVQSIFFSMGRMEKELDVPGIEDPGSFLVADARAIMQDFTGKISVRPADYILTGKAGTPMTTPLVLKALRDTAPIPNFDLVGIVAPRKKLFFGKTGPDGILTVKQLMIPFVPKGTLLYVTPDFGAAVNNVCSFSALDMGIKFPEQTLLFNIEPATFALQYSATAVSALAVPKDFGQDAFLRKYLCDSCFLKPASNAGNADFYFTVTTQVSCYSNDSTEMTVFKAENAVTIRDSGKKNIMEKTAVVHERAYETNTPFPMGLFFWEAAKASSHMVKEMLNGL